MPQLSENRLFKSGNSIVVVVPKGWLKWHKLHPGDKVKIVSNGKLTISPLKDGG